MRLFNVQSNIILKLTILIILFISFRLLKSEVSFLAYAHHLDAEKDISVQKYRLVEFGWEAERNWSVDSLTLLYGFLYENFGCYYTEIDKRFATDYNSQVIQHLKSRNGKDWYLKFKTELNALGKDDRLNWKNRVDSLDRMNKINDR